MKDIYLIFGDGIADLTEVGGKARSLMTMAENGLPVPPGLVLPVKFFQPWLDRIHDTGEWRALVTSEDTDLGQYTAALKSVVSEYRFTPDQRTMVESAFSSIHEPDAALYAVRSSSPEEDLEKASFAGVYETVLGVRRDGLEDAVRTVFLSALDERAFLYKRQHGFSLSSVRIAVVIQRQIASDVAGVGFSLNPLTNCYDEAVINANWGLGESIVSGAASPDRFVVDKVNKTILERHCGGKEVSYFLLPDGGTETRSVPKNTELCLTDNQVLELNGLIVKVEAAYGMPVDIEWALFTGKLYLLQARPITTYLPLPKNLLTLPEEPRRLYLDLTLVEQGVQRALSPMGAEWFGEVSALMFEKMSGRDMGHDAAGGFGGTAGGRFYLNISTMLFLMSASDVADEFEGLDAAAAEVLRALPKESYRTPEKPAYLRGILLAGLFRSAGTITKTLEGMVLPDRFDKRYHEGTEAYRKALDQTDTEKRNLKDYYIHLTSLAVDLMLNVTIPTLIDAEAAKSTLRKLFSDEPEDIRKRADALDRALPNNVTTEMGLAITALARMFQPEDYNNIPALVSRVKAGDLPAGGKAEWDRFMDRFGFRGPLEIDLASPRFCEDFGLLIAQMRTFASLSPDMDPAQAFERQKQERENAAEFLQKYLDGKSRLKAMEFKKLYQILLKFGGYRESHKYYLVMASYRVRQRILAAAEQLASKGRLKNSGDVFYLTIDDLESGLDDESVDLVALVEKNRRSHAPFEAVATFPALIDSRGTILRPPRPKDTPGQFFGDAVSAGVVKGPVKVLRSPGEKPVNPGDILVIHAADPGWTPLFIAAGGIVLEVGGMLQHGAIIAREYGKPCVAGIDGVLDKFADGRMVEMDGAAGSVRFID